MRCSITWFRNTGLTANTGKVLICQEMLSLQQNRLATFSAYVTQAGQTTLDGVKLGKFKYLDFLDFADISETTAYNSDSLSEYSSTTTF